MDNLLSPGGLQWVLDWAVMVALSHAGLPVRQANVVGRICGALCGFWMNGRFTFACEDTAVGRVQLQRFLVMWIATTVVSTSIVSRFASLSRAWPRMRTGLRSRNSGTSERRNTSAAASKARASRRR